jgi:PKD repeat protein
MKIRIGCHRNGRTPLLLIRNLSIYQTKMNLRKRLIVYLLIAFLAFFSIGAFNAFADIIIDNRDSETLQTGVWNVSGGSNPYGTDSQWGRGGDTFTWRFTPTQTGDYQVEMWWTDWSSRTIVPVTIQHLDGPTTKYVDQRENGGKWNNLDIYSFVSGTTYDITITSQPYPTSTSADAVRFVLVGGSDPTAGFTASSTNGTAPLAVQFTDQSIGDIDTRLWTFGDGGTSTAQHPSHTYNSSGVYTVTLQVTGSGGTDTVTLTDYITVTDTPTPPIASFSGTPVSGVSPLLVSFSDSSSGDVDTWSWSFGDGGTSTAQNPSHTYNTADVYTVTLQVTGSGGTHTATLTDYISVFEPGDTIIIDNRDSETLQTGVWNVSGGSNPYGTDSQWGRGGDTFTWRFTPPQTGDYQVSMWWTEWSSRTIVPVTIQHLDGPTTKYVDQRENGGKWNNLDIYSFVSGTTYDIIITSQPYPTSTSADAVRFVLVGSSDPTAGFTASPTNGVAPLAVQFTDQSIGNIQNWSWTFGDGGTSTAQNPSHTYNSSGDYTVTLQATGSGGTDTATQTDYITVTATPTPPIASFSGTPVSGVAPLLVSFSDSSSGDVDTWSWSFGDGGTSTAQNPSHTYNSSGDYTVTLQATGSGVTDTATLTDYITVTATPTPPIASFSGTPVSGVAPLLVSFSDSSSGDVDTWSWSFGDGGTSTAQNPSHTYNSSGDYTVTLQATGSGVTDTATLTDYINVTEATGNVEHIYICYIYSNPIENLYYMLESLGAHQEGDVWKYTNSSQNKEYIIHPIGNDVEALKQALMTQDAHVILSGHANYGWGPIPATTEEDQQGYIDDIYFIDDPRVLNVSSMVFPVKIRSLQYSQAYPNWRPIFQDGTSGIMPFCFSDPAGDPPYNYWITYQVPGDPTYYRVDPPHYTPIERNPDCGSPAWYSPNRKSPDPTDPNEKQYFITNLPLSLSIGSWITSQAISGYYDQDYLYKDADPLNIQDNEVRWVFKVPQDGNYSVSAFWPASPQNTTNARYSVSHAGGSATVMKDQTINGGAWNELGVFLFTAGDEYAVILTDNADAGQVVADAVKIIHSSDPGILDEEIDNLTYPTEHYGSYTSLFLKEPGIKKEDLKYKRLFYNSCKTGRYYLDSFSHGIVWYSVKSVNGSGLWPYLGNYLQGKSDEEIWEIVNDIERFYDYYDFSKKPSEQ